MKRNNYIGDGRLLYQEQAYRPQTERNLQDVRIEDIEIAEASRHESAE